MRIFQYFIIPVRHGEGTCMLKPLPKLDLLQIDCTVYVRGWRPPQLGFGLGLGVKGL